MDLQSLKSLKDGWHGEDSKTVPKHVLELLPLVLQEFGDARLGAIPEGGVDVRWIKDRVLLCMETDEYFLIHCPEDCENVEDVMVESHTYQDPVIETTKIFMYMVNQEIY